MLSTGALIILEIDSHSGGERCTNEWKLVDVASNSQRGSDERVRRKSNSLPEKQLEGVG